MNFISIEKETTLYYIMLVCLCVRDEKERESDIDGDSMY